jgi:hypothetical protein
MVFGTVRGGLNGSGAIPEVVGERLGIFWHGSADSIYDKLIALLQAPEALGAMAVGNKNE